MKRPAKRQSVRLPVVWPTVTPRTVDDLSFTARQPDGRIDWWAPTPPATTYWHAHELLGRAYGAELLALARAPRRGPDISERTLVYIVDAMLAHRCRVGDGVVWGFLGVISEALFVHRRGKRVCKGRVARD